MLVLGFDDYEAAGRRLAQALSLPFEKITVHHFPDGESKVRLPPELPERVIICRSLDFPNNKLIELLLCAETAREQGVKNLTLVAPYLCYMRQDMAFQPGEAISQKIIGRFLAGLFDAVITTNAHLHRIKDLSQAFPGIKAVNITTASIMSAYLKLQGSNLMLVGPDSESAQWVEAIADDAGFDYVVGQKTRLGDQHVKISLPEGNYAEKKIVLIDDVISTGHTLITIATLLHGKGVTSINALVTHALFDETTTRHLHRAGIEHIWSTDSIPHPSNSLNLDRLLASAIRE